jgi:hypothetical protein
MERCGWSGCDRAFGGGQDSRGSGAEQRSAAIGVDNALLEVSSEWPRLTSQE